MRMILVIGVLLLGLLGNTAQAQKPYTMGLFQSESMGRQEYAQLLLLMKEGAGAYQKKFGPVIEVKTYPNDKEFLNGIQNGTVDLIINYSSEALKLGFKPLVRVGLFNAYAQGDCIMVRKNSPYKTIKDLKDKPFGLHIYSTSRFFRLAQFTQTNPMTTYHLKGGANDASLAYMLSIGEVEGALLNLWVTELMKRTNPGAVKNLVSLGCQYTCPIFLAASKRLYNEQGERFKTFLMGLKDEKLLVRFRPLIRELGLVFHPYSLKEIYACAKNEKAANKRYEKENLDQSYMLWSRLEGKYLK